MARILRKQADKVARPGRFELPAPRLGGVLLKMHLSDWWKMALACVLPAASTSDFHGSDTWSAYLELQHRVRMRARRHAWFARVFSISTWTE